MCSLFKRKGHSYPVKSVVFSPNGEYLASGSKTLISECGGYRTENASIPSKAMDVKSKA